MITKKNARLHAILKITALILCHAAFVYAQTPLEENLDSLSLEDLMSIQVTSVSKKAQNLSDSAAAIFVITGEELMRSGATSIPEALRMVPGIHVARIDSNKWAISSRGFNSRFTEKLLVLIDGRSVYTPSFSGVYWEVQGTLLEDVDRIEVIRGPGASLWGANAVNGVINIITKHAADTRGGLVSIGGGTMEQAFGSARYGASLGEGVYGRIYAKYFKRDEFEYAAGGDAGDDWDTFRTGFRMDSKLTGPDNLTFQGDIYTGNISQRNFDAPSLLPPYSLTVDDDASVSGGNLILRWQRILSSTSEFTLQAYYDRTEREDIYVYEKRDSFDLDFQHRFDAAGLHDIVWGARCRYTHDDFSHQYIAELDPDSRGDYLLSAFIQDEISIVKETLWLILGSKFEHNDYSGYEIQPSGRLLWAPHSDHRFWTAVSRAVRTPSRVEHDGRINTMTIAPSSPLIPFPISASINGDTSFDSEELMAYEAGYRFVPSHDFSLDFAIFFNDYDKLRMYVLTDPILGDRYIEQAAIVTNNAHSETYGLELSAVWHPAEWLKTDFAYSFLNTDVPQGGIGGEASKHQVSLRANVSLTDDLDMNIWLRYVDDAKANTIEPEGFGIYEIDDYMTFDLKIAWHFTENLEFIAAGQNLLDEGHVEFVQEILIAPTEVPRSFYGQVRYSF